MTAIQNVTPDRANKFTAYLKMVVRNKALDWLKRWKRQRTYLESTIGRSIRSAFSEVISQEAQRLFEKALDGLTKRERRAIIMRIVDDLTYVEIGKKLRVSTSTAKMIVFQAKGRLEWWARHVKAV